VDKYNLNQNNQKYKTDKMKKDIKGGGCCRIESVVSIDGKGQMVLPKEVREKADIQPGDKLILVSWEKEGKVCCMFLIRSENFTKPVREMLELLILPSGGKEE